ncbi:S9 family peptidase [Terracidiphilus gabretensis]|uniref:S9 family peptidase n=1 Tax=Terracidiphilus gabretensis TaxID=1577687 RepID=UPI00071BE18C|nr:S9 family peptidase [Terracidiphilus gabretensis]
MTRIVVFRRIAAGLILLLSSVASSAQTAPDKAHIDEVLRGLNRGRSVGQVAVSPDGSRLAWIDLGPNPGLRIAPISNISTAEPVQVSGRCSESDILWRPDSKALAFFASCGDAKQADLYLSHLDGQPAVRLTQLTGYTNEAAFSPDGTKMAFLYVEGATRPAGALAAMKPFAGVIGEDGIEIQRIAVADATAGEAQKPQQVTPANLHAFEFGWSPDSKSLAYTAAEPPGENNWWTAKLYAQTIGASAPEVILAPAEVPGPLHGLQMAVPRWSPDGKNIAFIGGLMSDQGSTGGDVWLVPASGGAPRNLTPGAQSSVAWIDWAGDSTALYVVRVVGGEDELGMIRAGSNSNVLVQLKPPVFRVAGSIGDGRISHSISFTADHKLAVFRASSFDHPTEIYAVRTDAQPGATVTTLAGLTQLSHLNDGVEPAWGKSESLSWKSDGFNVQGWLLLPKNYDPSKRYPLIVLVHGGPASAVESRWGAGGGINAPAFSALDYFVLQVNPRGSYGQGEAFVQANRKDFGYGDLRDILGGVDAAEKKYPIDDKRVGLTGWSYGGFMSMFAVTQTHRFRAAVAGAGISDWQSYYGENSIGQWMIPYFGASVYDDPAVYAKSSAINFIKRVKTPTLVVVGDRDGECPAPQSFEFWHALRDEHVPTQFVVYPNEGHGFVDPAHRRDVMERAVDWFARYMPE